MSIIGLGDSEAQLNVYIANRPPMDEYAMLDDVRSMRKGEIADIAQATGNHWRKIFNVYAKLVYSLNASSLTLYATWQAYRDSELLRSNSNTALYFSPFLSNTVNAKGTIHLIMGKGYAEQLSLDQFGIHLNWVSSDFAIDRNARLIVCPYFDYRQLSNAKIDVLIELIHQLEQ